jgi:hypothetical protein
MNCAAQCERHSRLCSLIATFVCLTAINIVEGSLSSSNAQQAATATLSGTVKDPNGAVIADAQVQATQTATSVKRETTTNAEGVFVLTNLAAAEYEVKIQSPGFAVRKVAVTLQVGQTFTLDLA